MPQEHRVNDLTLEGSKKGFEEWIFFFFFFCQTDKEKKNFLSKKSMYEQRGMSVALAQSVKNPILKALV